MMEGQSTFGLIDRELTGREGGGSGHEMCPFGLPDR
jgi:hypothetical protein